MFSPETLTRFGDATGTITTTVRAPPDAQTQLNILHAPLRTLAQHIAPGMVVIDCGGAGQCGPNTLAYLLGLAGIATLDGPQLRASVQAYVAVAPNLRRRTNCLRPDNERYTLGELILECHQEWPERDHSKPATVGAWAAAIAQPATWTDLAFLHCVADAFEVDIDTLVVNDLSELWHLGCLEPCEKAPSRARLAVGMWLNRHLVAIAMTPMRAAAEPRSLGQPPPDDSNEPVRGETRYLQAVASAQAAVSEAASATANAHDARRASEQAASHAAQAASFGWSRAADFEAHAAVERARADEVAASADAAALRAASETAALEALRHRPAALSDAILDYERAEQRAAEAAQDAAEAEADAADAATDADAAGAADKRAAEAAQATAEADAAQAARHAGEEAAIRDELGRRLQMARRGEVPPSRATLGAVVLDLHARADAAAGSGSAVEPAGASTRGNAAALAPKSTSTLTSADLALALGIVADTLAESSPDVDDLQERLVSGKQLRRAIAEVGPDPSELHLHQMAGSSDAAIARARHACVLVVGVSIKHQGPMALVIRMADGSGRYMVPGGRLESTDVCGYDGALREFAEEVLGLRQNSSEARQWAVDTLHRAQDGDLLSGPYGSTSVHEAYLLQAEAAAESIDALMDMFVPNTEAQAAALIPLTGLDGSAATAQTADGQQITLRNHLGLRRVQAACALELALPRPTAGGASKEGELTTKAEVEALLASATPPTALVACEFSGAVRSALEAEGVVAISADLRPCDIGGLHYRGDARDILPLTRWARVYLFPPCFQQLRADVNCLGPKIADGRAFWGSAFVIFCICCEHADMVIVEQSDTIVHDYLDFTAYPDVQVAEFRTTEYGDAKDKFVRLTLRNAVISAPNHAPQRAVREPNAHRRFANPDERDRVRSSWQPFPNTCTAVAQARPRQSTAEPLDYMTILALFAIAWHNDGGPVPIGYMSKDAKPPSPSAREYQTQRGPGDGRHIVTVAPEGAEEPREAETNEMCDIIMTADDKYEAALRSAALFGRLPKATPTHPPDTPVGTGTISGTISAFATGALPVEPEAMDTGEAAKPPTLRLAEEHTVDVRNAGEGTALLLFVSVLAYPLVLAHVNGFTSAGLVLPVATKRPEAMAAVQTLCTLLTSAAAYIAFMVGEYADGVRLFTVPLDYRPEPDFICHRPEQRQERGRRGAAFVWCTLAALAGTALEDPAARAILSCDMFVKPVHTLADAPLTSEKAPFNFGVEQARSAIARPLLDDEDSPPAWRALARLTAADALLVAGLNAATAAGDDLLEGWADRVSPLVVGDVPPHLLESLPDFSDERLDTAPLSAQPHPIRTPYLPLPPQQLPADASAPACPTSAWEMLTEAGQQRLGEWLEAARLDLVKLRDELARGANPDNIERRRPQPIAIGQSEMHPWAQGRVWDCTLETGACCVIADFQAPILENLNRAVLAERLHHYPDQTLLANLVDGARLDADVELQLVLVPHLFSLAHGYESVAKELRRMESAGWYRSFPHIPYFPMYFNGNGAVSRKLEPDRWRRCVEGGGPRQVTLDASGLRAISINDASHVRFMPRHFEQDQRPEFRQWLAARGLPPEVREVPEEGGAVRASKWPKERKPKLVHAMRDMAIFGRAAHRTGQAVYTAGDDAKDYFSQMPMAAAELSKVGVMFLADDPDSDGQPRLRFVSERVLGFGTHGASNIAQRLSDAIMVMYYEDMDTAEAEAGLAGSEEERRWLEDRLAVMRRRGSPCHPIRRFTNDPSQIAPDIPAPTSIADIPAGYVCPELRLYSGYMYTDDNELLFVGVLRTLRGLRVWRLLVTRINLLMAIEAKRSLGTWCKWLGVVLVAGLGLVLVPKAKILRANEALSLTLQGRSDFQTYRSLCGLLEHLLAVVLRGRNVMHGLYRPHGPDGAAREGPSAIVECDDLMQKQLRRWQHLLTHACGVSVKRALLRSELERLPSVHFDLTSDACYAEVKTAGIGGYMHGLYWYFAIPEADRPLLSIPILEFLGVCFNILAFHSRLVGLGAGAHLLYRTDALTTARTLPEESMRSTLLVEAYQWLTAQVEWLDLAPRMSIQHCYGDCNPLSDYVSRAKWREFFQLNAQLGVKPIELELPDRCRVLYEHIIFVLQPRRADAGPGAVGASSSSPLPQEVIEHLQAQGIRYLDAYYPALQSVEKGRAIYANPGDTAHVQCLRKLYACLSTGAAKTPTFKALEAVLARRLWPRRYPRAENAWTAYGASRSNFRVYKRKLADLENAVGIGQPFYTPVSTVDLTTWSMIEDDRPEHAGHGAVGASSSSPLSQEVIENMQARGMTAAEVLTAVAAQVPRPQARGDSAGAPLAGTTASDTLRAVEAARAVITANEERGATPKREGGGRPLEPATPAKRRVLLSGVSLPPAPEKQAKASALLEAGRQYAQARMLAMTQGGEPGMALRADIAELVGLGSAIDELVAYGVNANTWDKDCRAWDMWVVICEGHGCSPRRTAAEAREFPERNAHLLAALMFHAYATCKPRDATRQFIKPRSAMAYPLAIIRIFARWAISMPSYKLLKAALSGIARMYIAYHGPYSMAPRRSEPMKFAMVRALNAIPNGALVGRLAWDHNDHDVFMFRRLNRLMIVTAFRLGEIVRHTSGEIMFITFGSLVWSIGGVLVEAPTVAQLDSMRSGIDGARLAPSRSKPDQWGEIHCPFSVVLTYEAHDPINAAAGLADIERRCQIPASERATTPLFHDARREPYTHHYLHAMLREAIAHVYGKAAASLYSWHSYRSGLATALHAAGVSDPMIQLICRWMCPESLHVYRRMGVAEHERLIKGASMADVDVIQTTNQPVVFADQGYAELVGELAGPRAAAEEKAFEKAIQAALDPFGRDATPPNAAAAAKPGGAQEEVATPPRPTATLRAPPQPPRVERIGEPVTDELRVGDEIAILRETWPKDPCSELQGLAWHGTVAARAKGKATVRFSHARTRNGRRYENAQVTLDVLRHITLG